MGCVDLFLLNMMVLLCPKHLRKVKILLPFLVVDESVNSGQSFRLPRAALIGTITELVILAPTAPDSP